MPEGTLTQVQGWIELMRQGDAKAIDALIERSGQRLQKMTRRLFRDFPKLAAWVDEDDVLQGALIRLVRVLRTETPQSAKGFFALATLQIRRELLDLVRRFYGPQGSAAHRKPGALAGSNDSDSPRSPEKSDQTLEPVQLAFWSEFHAKVEGMPEDMREVFDLLWYQELTQAEAATILEVSDHTIKDRWRRARLYLGKYLKDPSKSE